MPLNFVKSQKGADHLVHEGYRFVKDKVTPFKTIWKCVNYKVNGCKGRAHTYDGEVVFHNENHSCTPDIVKVKVKEVLANIKKMATESSDTPMAIVSKATDGMIAEVTGALPTLSAMTKEIQYTRRKDEFPTATPQSLTDLVIPNRYKRTKRNELFLMYDSGPSEDRLLIFSTERDLDYLKNSKELFADGTFKTAPLLFDQIYTLHAKLEKQVVPLVFALMNKRTTESYIRMLNAVKQLIPTWNPEVITTDYEKAAIRAFREVFPRSRQHGCHFHFGQRIWKRIQTCPQLAGRYKADPQFAIQVKCLSALAFVPPDQVVDCLERLVMSRFYR